MKKMWLKSTAIGLVLTSFASIPSFAQDLFVEEILVTARKQTESIQDVPLSLTAIGEVEIDQLGIETTEDVIKLSPGLTYSRGIGNQDVRPDIRGITPLSGRSNIAILVDGVDITTDAVVGTGAGQLISLGLYDLERVEVVRGPQSALFGRNAFGGAINYITKKPAVDFEGTINAEVGSYGSNKLKLGLSGPINEQLLYRVNLSHSEFDGQYDEPDIGALEAEDTRAASITLQWLPNDLVELIFRMDFAKQEKTSSAVATSEPNACFTQDSKAAVFTKDNDFCDQVIAADENYSRTYLGKIPKVTNKDIDLSDDEFLGTTNELQQYTTLLSVELSDEMTLTWNNSLTRAFGIDDYDLDYRESTDQLDTLGGSASTNAYFWVDQDNLFNFHTDEEFDRDVLFQDIRIAYDNYDNVRWLLGIEFNKEDYEGEVYSRTNDAIERDTESVDYTPPFSLDVECFEASGLPFNSFLDLGAIQAAGCAQVSFLGDTLEQETYRSQLPYEQNRYSKSWGIYGSYDWAFHEDWELSLSARYQEDEYEIEFDSVDRQFIIPFYEQEKPLTFFIPVIPKRITAKDNFSAFNPRMVLTNFVTDSVMIYGSIAKGTKPGGYSFQYEVSPERRKYTQETILSYELGWKTSWQDDRIIVNGAIFQMDNSDKQANNREFVGALDQPFGYVDNIGESRIRGLELQVVGRVNENLTASVNYAYIDAKIVEYSSLQGKGLAFDDGSQVKTDEEAIALGDPDYDLSGNRLPRTPQHNFLLTLEYDWDINDDIEGFARWDTKYLSSRFTDVDELIIIPSKTTHDIQFGAKTGDWEVIAFINNVTDDDTPSSSVGFVNFTESFITNLIVYPAEKRNGGVRVKYYF